MTPHAQTTMMIDREVRRYTQDLARWSQQVRAAHSDVEAFRLASHRPVPAALIRSLGTLWSRERHRAEADIERSLSGRIEKLGAGDPGLPMLMRLAQGHWPRLYQRLETLRRG